MQHTASIQRAGFASAPGCSLLEGTELEMRVCTLGPSRMRTLVFVMSHQEAVSPGALRFCVMLNINTSFMRALGAM